VGYPVTESCTIMLRVEMVNSDVYRRGCTKIENILRLCSELYTIAKQSKTKRLVATEGYKSNLQFFFGGGGMPN
jgi:hypothetical protein